MRGWLPISYLIPALVLIGAIGVPVAHAGWNPDAALLKATTANIPRIAACSDGVAGTFVVWQEETAPGQGDLRVQHVLSTGDVDPAWPAGGLVVSCAPLATASLLFGALPDRLGGVYVWWRDDVRLKTLRVLGSAQLAAGWPACGQDLGAASSQSPMPSFVEDGADGLYAAWVEGSDSPLQVYGAHLGPDNTGPEEWLGVLTFATTDAYWPRLALAPDGGFFLAWGAWSPDTTVRPSAWRLRRFTAAGANATGWPALGISLGAFHRELLGPETASALIDVSQDGRGGAFVLIGHVVGTSLEGYPLLEHRLYRLQGDGQNAADWPGAGRLVPNAPVFLPPGMPPEGSVRAFSDGTDGAHAGHPIYYDHATDWGVERVTATGEWSPGPGGILVGHDVFAKGSGGVCFAEVSPHGPTGLYQPPALISFAQTVPSNGYAEYDDTHILPKYGGVAIAPTEDGGVVFLWSQVRDRYGLFAKRFTSGGEVTGVTPTPARLALERLRFVPRHGVRAIVSAGAGSARFELFDLAGRRIASEPVQEGGPREVTLRGTHSLPRGLYFARLVARGGSAGGKVVVAD